MKKSKQKKKNHPFALMLTLAVLLFFGNSTDYLHAETPPPPPGYTGPVSQEGENVNCEHQMDIFTSHHMEQYRAWMESHFNNKSSTTSLLDNAIARYKELRSTLYNEYYKYGPHGGAVFFSEGLEGPACKLIVDNALDSAKRILESKAVSTSTVKKTTALIYKYQDVNSQLAQLSKNFLTMKAHLNTFATKLPCYIKKQCNKG